MGLFSLAKRYGKPRLEAACLIALELGATRSADVREILANGRDQVVPDTTPEWVSPAHANVRHVLQRIGEHPVNRVAQLLPWNVAAEIQRQPDSDGQRLAA